MCYPIIRLGKQTLHYNKNHKQLGLVIDSPKLNWRNHITYLIKEFQSRLDIMKTLSSPVWGASPKILRNFYISKEPNLTTVQYSMLATIKFLVNYQINGIKKLSNASHNTARDISRQRALWSGRINFRKGFKT